MLSFSSETPFCQTDSGPALNPEFPLIPLFKFPGPLLYNGQGVTRDYVRAHMWVSLAALQGDPNAMNSRDIIAKKMSPAQIAEAQRLARDWNAK